MQRESRKMGEDGMITVEGVLSLVPFILVILGIISFTNIFAVHNRIQYAMYQMGSELTCYTYFYQALGIRAADLVVKGDADEATEELDSAMEELDSFLEQIGSLEDDVKKLPESDWSNIQENLDQVFSDGGESLEKGKQLAQTAKELLSDPKALFRAIVYLAIEKAEELGKGQLLAWISSVMMNVYLDESYAKYHPMTADQYLKYYGVKGGVDGLDFSESRLFSDEGTGEDLDTKYRTIDMVVEYDIEVYFFKLFLKDPTIHVVQRCTMPAWLDGDGVTYSK